jgi:hypothetical protein
MPTNPTLISAIFVIAGLSGLLATFSYGVWWRGLHGWRWRTLVTLPRLLSPFCLSLALFCSGMALGAMTNSTPSWWQLAAWSVPTVVFAAFAASVWSAGRRNGWDTPIEEIRQP